MKTFLLALAVCLLIPPLHAEPPAPPVGEADFRINYSEYSGRSPLHLQNLIHRELVRQAVVISALHYAGFLPEDVVMDVVGEDPNFKGPRFQVSVEMTPDDYFLYSIAPEGADAEAEFYVETPIPESYGLSHIASALVTSIPSDLASYLTKTLGVEQARTVPYPIPDIALEELEWHLNPLDQFQVVRYWHARASHEGLTEDVLSGLARGYANLGQLTRHFWNTFPFAASARSLLYAELLHHLHGENDATREVRAYVYALAPYPKYALEIIESMEGPGSPWVDTLAHFCRYDLASLREEAASSVPHAQLAAFLGMLSVEDYRSANYVTRIYDELIEFNPGNIRALEISNKEVGVSRLHFSTKEGPRIAQDLFQNGLPRLQELPKNLKNIIPPPLSQEDESPSLLQWTLWGIVGKSPLEQGKPAVEFTPHAYRDFYLATTETPFAGDGYPSWTLLGKIFWDTHFYLSVTRLHFMAVMWSVDTDETVRDLKPGFEGHPFQNILRAYDKSLSNTETRQLLESVSLGDTVPPMFLFLNRWAKGKTEQFADQSYKAAWDSLFKGAHLDLLRASAMARYLNDENERTIARLILNHLSAYHPPSLANLLFDDPASDTYREQAETLLPGNPLVAGFIGARLRKDGKLEEAIPYLETAAHELGKRWYFTKLAEIYLDQGDEERWLQTKLAYTEQVDTGLGKARNYQEIAFHYMKTGRAELALPYSLRSANSYSAWGLKTATINHLILGNREQALSYMNAEMDRYGSTLNRRIRYWMLGKLGDVETLRRELQAIPPGSNFRVGSNRYLLGFHEEAVRELIQAYERKSDNYNLLLASLILMQDGKHEEAQQLWKRIRDEYEGNSVKNYSRRANKQLAELFLEADQSSLTGEEVLTRAEEIRSSSMRQSVEYNYDFKYFTGLFLIAGGHPELAETHLKEAMHLDADRISLLFICAALRSLNVEPLDMFRTPAPIH